MASAAAGRNIATRRTQSAHKAFDAIARFAYQIDDVAIGEAKSPKMQPVAFR